MRYNIVIKIIKIVILYLINLLVIKNDHYLKKYDINTYKEKNYYSHIKSTLIELKDIDGIFVSSDLIAAQVIQVCNELKIRISEDIQLVGFDDVDIATLTTPTITTIHQPIKEMATLAIELIEKKNKGLEVIKNTILPIELIIRNSTINR